MQEDAEPDAEKKAECLGGRAYYQTGPACNACPPFPARPDRCS